MLLALGLAVVPGVRAAELESLIGDFAFKEATGSVGINMAAGAGNAQINAVAILFGVTGEVDLLEVRQESSAVGGEIDMAHVGILGDAFADATGIIRVNQASGYGNVQGNLVAVGLGVTGVPVGDAVLAQAASVPGEVPGRESSTDGARLVEISPGAFQHATGIVQVNQVAGSGNRTVNQFVLDVQIDTEI